MKKHFFLTLAILLTSLFASAQGYETTIPDEDHMSYFDLRGPVQVYIITAGTPKLYGNSINKVV